MGFKVPSIKGTKELKVGASLEQMLLRNNRNSSGGMVKIYSSNEEVTQLVSRADATFRTAGYRFAYPGQNGPFVQGNCYTGFYTREGDPDILFTADNVPDQTPDLAHAPNIPGVDPNDYINLIKQLKGSRSSITLVIVNGMMSGK
jgi:hypothetical protein